MTELLTPIGGQAAWKGPALDWRRDSLFEIGAADIAEIDAALARVRPIAARDLARIDRAGFALPTLGPRLGRLRRELETGRGFALLRGLPRERYALDDMAMILFGIGVHVGAPIPQSWHGELLGQVVDVSDIDDKPRGYRAGGRQNMHTDSCDVVALMCVRGAKSGGVSRIASAVAVHDALVARRPDLAQREFRGFRLRRTDEDARHGAGMVVSPDRIPRWAREAGRFSSYQMAYYARRAAEFGDATLDALDEETLTEVERLASSPEFHLDMKIGEGDVQFLNNRVILHGRSDYADWPELERRRHMLRLWLTVPEWPRIPARQVFHTDEDRRLWLARRDPRLEIPSAYFAEMEARKARKLAAEGAAA